MEQATCYKKSEKLITGSMRTFSTDGQTGPRVGPKITAFVRDFFDRLANQNNITTNRTKGRE